MCAYAVSKIKLVKPEKVLTIENALIQAAQQGKLRNKLSEQELVAMLESQTKTENKLTVLVCVISVQEEGHRRRVVIAESVLLRSQSVMYCTNSRAHLY